MTHLVVGTWHGKPTYALFHFKPEATIERGGLGDRLETIELTEPEAALGLSAITALYLAKHLTQQKKTL